jgi:hypothetical protein
MQDEGRRCRQDRKRQLRLSFPHRKNTPTVAVGVRITHLFELRALHNRDIFNMLGVWETNRP